MTISIIHLIKDNCSNYTPLHFVDEEVNATSLGLNNITYV